MPATKKPGRVLLDEKRWAVLVRRRQGSFALQMPLWFCWTAAYMEANRLREIYGKDRVKVKAVRVTDFPTKKGRAHAK